MFTSDKWRWATIVAPPVVFASIAILVACSEANGPASADDWAGAVVERQQVRSQLQFFGAAAAQSPITSMSVASDVPLPVLPPEADAGGSANRTHVMFHHARMENGKTLTYAFLMTARNRPPTRIYGFVNGRLSLELHPKYKRVGDTWIRTSAKVSLYDDQGKRIADLGSEADSTSGSLKAQTFAPQSLATGESELVGNEETAACWKERMDNLTAYAVWTAATWAAFQASLLCPATGPLAYEACSKAYALAAAALAAYNAWLASMDRLTQCELAAWIRSTNPTSGGDSGSWTPPPDSGTTTDLMTAVNEFINRALAAGSVWCNSERTYCIYSSAQLI